MSVSPRKIVAQFGSHYVLELTIRPGVPFWTCMLAIDADGHPQCYHPKGSPPGLDFLANAGKPGNWWALATGNGQPDGRPVIQTDTDPAPGFYVSMTSLVDPTHQKTNPLRYVHAGRVPYIVLPRSPKVSVKQKLGDIAMVFNEATGKNSCAIYADIGPINKLGEGSMALAQALGIAPNPKQGWSKETIAMIYWPGSSMGWPVSPTALEERSANLFNDWGGYASARIALPQFNWDRFQFPPPLD